MLANVNLTTPHTSYPAHPRIHAFRHETCERFQLMTFRSIRRDFPLSIGDPNIINKYGRQIGK